MFRMISIVDMNPLRTTGSESRSGVKVDGLAHKIITHRYVLQLGVEGGELC